MSKITLHLKEKSVKRQTESLSYFLILFVLIPADYICFFVYLNRLQGQIHVCGLWLSGVFCLIELMTIAMCVFPHTSNLYNLVGIPTDRMIIQDYHVLQSVSVSGFSFRFHLVTIEERRITFLYLHAWGCSLCERFICSPSHFMTEAICKCFSAKIYKRLLLLLSLFIFKGIVQPQN